MINITNLTKSFTKVTAVDDLTISIGEGVSGLVGENGAGKSTLFRLISGVYQPNKGKITIDGYDSRSKEAKSQLFFLSDEPFYSLNNTPISLYDVYSPFFKMNKEKYMGLLDKFHLPIHNKMSTFSKGMKRQTFIALSLSMDVKYLLLDEAFDGLDPLVLENIKNEIIEKGKQGTAIVISTHNISLLERLADRFIVLSKGKLANQEDNNNNKDVGVNFVKWQVLFKKSYEEIDFKNAGINSLSFRKVGSLIHFIANESDDIPSLINKLEKPVLLEQIPIDKEESIKLIMLSAREGQ